MSGLVEAALAACACRRLGWLASQAFSALLLATLLSTSAPEALAQGGNDRPDLSVELPTASSVELAPGASFTLHAIVGNTGDGRSAATTLRYYRSSNATIDASDVRVGTDRVPALNAGSARSESISFNVPTGAGTYYYGACVDTVPGETVAGNNCSSVIQMVVSGNGGGVNPRPSEDDHGNDRASATTVEIPSTTSGELGSGDIDYFRIDIGQPGTLRLESQGGVDTYGELYNRVGTRIGDNDDGGADQNFRIQANNLAAGTYYLKVRGYSDANTGRYTLRVTGSARGDDGGGASPDLRVESPGVSSQALSAGASFVFSATVRNSGDARSEAATLRYFSSSDATIDASDTGVGIDAVSSLGISSASPESISLTAPNQGGTYFYGACVDAVPGETETSNNCSASVRIVVSSGGGNNNDDHGDNRATATLVEIPSTTAGQLGRGDRDYFRIDVGQGGRLQLETTGSVDTYGELYNSAGTKIEDNDDSGQGHNFRIATSTLEAGAYYLMVRGFSSANTGSYSLSVAGSTGGGNRATPDLIVELPRVSNASPAAGASIVLSAAVRNSGDARSAATTLHYYRSSNATIDASDTSVGNDTVASLAAGAVSPESISLSAPAQPGTYYYGACVDAVSGETATGNNCASGVRVVVSGGGGTGDDHGNTRDSATAVAIPSTTDGHLGRGDEDYFRIDVEQRGTLRLQTSGSIDTYGDFYNGSGRLLNTNDDSGAGRNFRIETGILEAGVYYLKVRGFASSSTGNYRLSVEGSARGGGGNRTRPDLVVESPRVDNATPAAGASFVLSATVRNGGDARSAAATLRYFSSSNATIDTSDTRVGTDSVSALGVGSTSLESISLTAPTQPGTYYYGACVSSVADETETGNNCSTGVEVVVPDSGNRTRPDLVVESPRVDNATPAAGASFVLSATVRNGGDARSAAATLRYFSSSNATIDTSDTRVGTDSVSALGVGSTSLESISLTAPTQPGTYYYGACVDTVTSETETGNNCSSGVEVVVPSGGGGRNNGDDHGDSNASATVVAIPSTTAGRLGAGDEDYFRIDAGQGARLRLETTGSVDTYGEFYDSQGTRIAHNDDQGSGLNFRIDAGPLDAGAYYLKVRGYSGSSTGSYHLAVTGNAGTVGRTRPDLTVESLSVSDAEPAAGAAFVLSASVRNSGDARSAATTLRYYRSSNATIEASDTRVGTDSVSALGVGATSPESISLTAPTAPGSYYYGACIDAVTGETASGNNCSTGVEIVVPSRVNPTPDTPVVTIAFGSVFTYGTDASTVTEGTDTEFTVTVNPRPESDLTVNLMVSQNGNFAESFQLGSRSVTFDTAHYYNNHRPDDSVMWRVATRDDGSPESDGSITVAIVEGDGYLVGSPSSATVTVVDNDAGRVPPPLVPILDPNSDLRPADLRYYDRREFGIHSGHSTELFGGESLRLVFMHAPGSGGTNYDEIEFSWSVEGGGSIGPVPGRGRNDRLVAYRAPAYVREEITATVTVRVTVRGTGVIARYSTSYSQDFTLDLTVRPNDEAPTGDLRGSTSERGDTYADGYVFWNGGQDVSFEHNPWINTTPGRTITYSFPEQPFSRNNRDLVPLRSGDPEMFRPYGWRHSTQGLREQFRQAFAHWEQYLNLRFREVDDDPNADWLIGEDPEAPLGTMASTFTGGGNTSSVAIATSGHFWNASRRYEAEAPLHEIGHALGLGHPHTQGAGANLDDAIMEYEAHGRAEFSHSEYIPLKFPADIIGAQHIWGKAPGAPRTAPDVPAEVTLAYDSNRNELVANWSNVLINGGSPITGYQVQWLKNSDPAQTNSPDAGDKIQRTDTITDPRTLTRTFTAPSAGDWSVQVRAVNAVGMGLRKRGPATGPGVPVASGQ